MHEKTPEQEAADRAAADKAAADAKKAAEDAENTRLNNIFTAREKRLEERLMKGIAEQLKALGIGGQAPASEDEDDEPEAPAEGNGQPAKPAASADPPRKQVDPQAKRLARQVAALQKQTEEAKAAAEAERATRLAENERSETRSALTSAGCSDKMLAAAMALLKEEKRIARNEDGQLVFLTPKGKGENRYNEEEPLAEGIKNWLASEDGKSFAAPRGTEGSGATGRGNAPVRDPSKLTKAERRKQAGEMLLNWAIRGRGVG